MIHFSRAIVRPPARTYASGLTASREGAPDYERACEQHGRYCEALRDKGILAKDTHDHTIRIAPPLVITSDQVDWALERIGTTLTRDFS